MRGNTLAGCLSPHALRLNDSRKKDPIMNDYGVATTNDTLRIERLLPGPIERVWLFLTDPEKRGIWLASGAIDPTIGGRVELVFRNSELTIDDDSPPARYDSHAGESRLLGTIVECDPPHLLAFTWGDGQPDVSQVRFELIVEGDDVRLIVTHTHLADRDAMLGVATGWHTHLDILRDRLRGQAPDGFWRKFAQFEAVYGRRISADL
jgi:uncharacterized protein YndB with AHSA1/START domain